MLLEFIFENYRSFRDETILSLEADGLSAHRNIIIEENNKKILPAIAIYGKNGGGKMPKEPKVIKPLFQFIHSY